MCWRLPCLLLSVVGYTAGPCRDSCRLLMVDGGLTHRAVRLVTLTTEGVLFLKTSMETCSSAVMRGLASAAGVSRPAGPKQLLTVMTAAAQRLVNWAGSLSSCCCACCCRCCVLPRCWCLLPGPALGLLVLTGAA